MISFTHNMTRVVIGTVGAAACGLACLFGATAPAQAHVTDTVRTERVSYADLDLHDAAGRRLLDRRVAHAARRVCDNGSRDIAEIANAQQCVRAALANIAAPIAR